MNNLDNLYDDGLYLIFSYNSIKDILLDCCLVNKYWNNLINKAKSDILNSKNTNKKSLFSNTYFTITNYTSKELVKLFNNKYFALITNLIIENRDFNYKQLIEAANKRVFSRLLTLSFPESHPTFSRNRYGSWNNYNNPENDWSLETDFTALAHIFPNLISLDCVYKVNLYPYSMHRNTLVYNNLHKFSKLESFEITGPLVIFPRLVHEICKLKNLKNLTIVEADFTHLCLKNDDDEFERYTLGLNQYYQFPITLQSLIIRDKHTIDIPIIRLFNLTKCTNLNKLFIAGIDQDEDCYRSLAEIPNLTDLTLHSATSSKSINSRLFYHLNSNKKIKKFACNFIMTQEQIQENKDIQMYLNSLIQYEFILDEQNMIGTITKYLNCCEILIIEFDNTQFVLEKSVHDFYYLPIFQLPKLKKLIYHETKANSTFITYNHTSLFLSNQARKLIRQKCRDYFSYTSDDHKVYQEFLFYPHQLKECYDALYNHCYNGIPLFDTEQQESAFWTLKNNIINYKPNKTTIDSNHISNNTFSTVTLPILLNILSFLSCNGEYSTDQIFILKSINKHWLFELNNVNIIKFPLVIMNVEREITHQTESDVTNINILDEWNTQFSFAVNIQNSTAPYYELNYSINLENSALLTQLTRSLLLCNNVQTLYLAENIDLCDSITKIIGNNMINLGTFYFTTNSITNLGFKHLLLYNNLTELYAGFNRYTLTNTEYETILSMKTLKTLYFQSKSLHTNVLLPTNDCNNNDVITNNNLQEFSFGSNNQNYLNSSHFYDINNLNSNSINWPRKLLKLTINVNNIPNKDLVLLINKSNNTLTELVIFGSNRQYFAVDESLEYVFNCLIELPSLTGLSIANELYDSHSINNNIIKLAKLNSDKLVKLVIPQLQLTIPVLNELQPVLTQLKELHCSLITSTVHVTNNNQLDNFYSVQGTNEFYQQIFLSLAENCRYLQYLNVKLSYIDLKAWLLLSKFTNLNKFEFCIEDPYYKNNLYKEISYAYNKSSHLHDNSVLLSNIRKIDSRFKRNDNTIYNDINDSKKFHTHQGWLKHYYLFSEIDCAYKQIYNQQDEWYNIVQPIKHKYTQLQHQQIKSGSKYNNGFYSFCDRLQLIYDSLNSESSVYAQKLSSYVEEKKKRDGSRETNRVEAQAEIAWAKPMLKMAVSQRLPPGCGELFNNSGNNFINAYVHDSIFYTPQQQTGLYICSQSLSWWRCIYTPIIDDKSAPPVDPFFARK